MARDVALMERARGTGETVLSVYSWERPTLSLGRNQAARDKYDVEEMLRRSIDVVRRPTGGRALIHWHEVTYSVTAAFADDDSLAQSYARINRVLLHALAKMGVDAAASSGGQRTPSPGDLPCFAAPAEGELMMNGAKLVGSAQLRENGALLQHGSILIDDGQSLISSLLRNQSAGVAPQRAATLREALGRAPDIDEVAEALFAAVRMLEDPSATSLEESEIRKKAGGYIAKYRNPLWTWRR